MANNATGDDWEPGPLDGEPPEGFYANREALRRAQHQVIGPLSDLIRRGLDWLEMTERRRASRVMSRVQRAYLSSSANDLVRKLEEVGTLQEACGTMIEAEFPRLYLSLGQIKASEWPDGLTADLVYLLFWQRKKLFAWATYHGGEVPPPDAAEIEMRQRDFERLARFKPDMVRLAELRARFEAGAGG